LLGSDVGVSVLSLYIDIFSDLLLFMLRFELYSREVFMRCDTWHVKIIILDYEDYFLVMRFYEC